MHELAETLPATNPVYEFAAGDLVEVINPDDLYAGLVGAVQRVNDSGNTVFPRVTVLYPATNDAAEQEVEFNDVELRRHVPAKAPKRKKATPAAKYWEDTDGHPIAVGDEVRYTHPTSIHSGGAGILMAIHVKEGNQEPVATVQLHKLSTWKESPSIPAFLRNLTYLSTPAPVAPKPEAAPKVEVCLSTKAWDLLETIEVCGGTVPFANVSSESAQACIAELEKSGLLVEEGGGFSLTPAGLLAAQQAAPDPVETAPVAEESETADFRMLPLSSIAITRNTRKVFDEVALAELAESIKAHGILQPIVVRRRDNGLTDPKGYELVAGERRYRAAELAGLTHVPAMVRYLTDREFLEVQLLENLQRVDVRPADEAMAFAELLNVHKFSPEEIALKVGKPAKFVLQRAKLVTLIPFWMEALQEERLPLVSAHELARLPAHSQLAAKKSLEYYYNGNSPKYDAGQVSNAIRRDVLRDLASVVFPKDDATLCPGVGACEACPKRSRANLQLFSDQSDKDQCLDAACFASKTQAYIQRRLVEIKQEDGRMPVLIGVEAESRKKYPKAVYSYEFEKGKKGAAGVVRALVLDGPEAGAERWGKLASWSKVVSEEDEAKKKAQDAIRLRKERVKKAERIILADKLTADLVPSATGPVGHAVLVYMLLEAIGSAHIALVVDMLGCPEPTLDERNTDWDKRDAAGNTPFRNWLIGQLTPRSFDELLWLYFTRKVRHRMEHEYEDRQFVIGSLLRGQGLGYEEVGAQADAWVENRYYTKKKKGPSK
ncbi:ParB/RepB/Spo0J family partition protein [Hymenobacter metallilatus]|nr:ParB/RepB/Spo0J family partition protein [Hymenobacter metallilatus]